MQHLQRNNYKGGQMNKIILIGRLTNDPEQTFTPSGTSLVKFSIAKSRYYNNSLGKKQEETSFFNCVAWAETGELIMQYVKKGHQIAVEGELKQDRWEKDGQKKTYN